MKAYNLIFPIWFLLFFPPVIFGTMIGNFLIDSLVVMLCYYVFSIKQTIPTLKVFYKKSIWRVWIFGFLADIIGAAILFICGLSGESFGLSYDVTSAICYDPFSEPLALVIIGIALLVSTVCIFLFNYYFSFKHMLVDKKTRFKVALTIALITIPWTFLLPTKWFY